MNATHAPHATNAVPRDLERENPPLGRGHRRTSPWLWFALILAMFAGALAWLRVNNSTVAPAPVGQRMLPETSAPVASTPAAPSERSVPAAPQRKAGPLRNREARPLAGNAQPSYPVSALRNGVQGSVTARLQVAPSGEVTDASIVSRTGQRDRDLDRAVLTTVRGWKFEPAIRDGRAIASVVNVPVDFRTER